MGRTLATIATLLILLLGAAFIVPAFLDWNRYRSDLEQAVSSIVGRRVLATGGIDISLLPEPRLRLGKVAVDAARKEGSILTVESVDVTLSLQALLGGRLEATAVKLVRPSLRLDFRSAQRGKAESGGRTNGFLMPATVDNIEIEDGTVAILAKEDRTAQGLTLKKIRGTLSAPAPGGSYRFAGRFLRGDQPFDIKFGASAGPGQSVKIAGTVADALSKSNIQADGLLMIGGEPSFEGTIASAGPPQPGSAGAPRLEVQAKATAKIGLNSMSLSDLAITLDPQNRPQILAGTGDVNFVTEHANFDLQARSLDADALLSAAGQASYAGGAPADWASLKAASGRLLWLYPNITLRVSMAADQVQLRGEPLENVKFDAQRSAGRWVFEKFVGLLPGDTAIKVVGVLSGGDGKPRLSASASADSKNIGRLARWITSGPADARVFPARALTVQGSITLSDDVTAFEGVTGTFDGMPFRASVHLDKEPKRRLVASLSGDSFDLSGIGLGEPAAGAQPSDGLIATLEAGMARLASSFGGDAGVLEMADLDISAGSVKTETLEAKNLAAHLKLSPVSLTVSKLSVETTGGLAVRGEGLVPLKGTGKGRFDGRIEARSAEALSQLAAFAGYDSQSLGGRQFEDFSPAAMTVNYEADPGAGVMTALLTGTLGPARIEGKAQLKGSLADWKTGQLAVQLGASAVDGGRLLAQFVPNSAPIQGAPLAPGTFSLRMNGTLQRLETSAAVETRPLQARLDGTTNLTAGSLQFAGKLSASSPAPEAFLAAPVLMLLGGEPASGLRVETNLTMTPGRFEASKLNAVSAKNAVSGRISFDASGSVPVLDADLKADRISAPALLAYFVSSEPSQLIVLTGNNPASAAQDIWTDRPFSPSAFQNASARVSLDAKTLKISDAISLTDGRAAAELRNGRLEIQKLEGKTLGGELTASLRLEAQGKGIAATTRLSLSNFDLAEAPEGGTPALLTGRASISLTASGLALSPRGIVSNLQGRGNIVLSDGQISKLSPPAVQKGAEELLAGQLPLTEDVITKKISEVSQSEDFKFQHLKVPFVIRDGMLEIRRASFRSRDGTVRMQAYLDMAKMQADSTWQAGVSSDRQAKWPPVKILISGQLRELGARPRSVGAEDFVRAVLVKKMEGDINRLENLNKPQAAAPAAAPAPPAWTAKQEPAQRTGPHKKREDGKVQRGAADANASRQQPQALPGPSQRTDFESRMRDILRGAGNTDPRAQRSP